MNSPTQRYLFILDDFEANIEATGDRLKPAVVEPLKALLRGITNSGLPHRVIITSRYDLKLPEFDRQLVRLQIGQLDRSDVEKKYQRLAAFRASATVDRDLQTQAKTIADGYPRLLEWLDKVLQDDRTDSESILAAMAGKQQEFLENILAAQLLAQQEPELLSLLARGTIFELPVPVVALQAMCEDIAEFDKHLERARSLGLLEVGLKEAVRVPRVLGLAGVENGVELAAIGVKVLHREWIENAEYLNEEQWVELHRLALLAGDGEIAVKMAQGLTDRWLAVSSNHKALALCQNTLALQIDGKIIYNLSKIYDALGEWEKSIELAHQSFAIYHEIGDRQGKAASLHQIAMIYTNQGKWDEALKHCHDSRSIQREIGDRQGEAASLHQISIIYTKQSKWHKARQFCDNSLAINREIGSRHGEVPSLHQIAMVCAKQGNFDEALKHCHDARTINREIGNRQGEAASLNLIAMIYENQGKLDKALQFCLKALAIKREIGELQGEATSLNVIARVHEKRGKLDEAIKSYCDSLAINRKIGDHQGEATSLNDMAGIALKQGDITQVEQRYLAAAQLFLEIRDYNGLFVVLCNLGYIFTSQAITYFAQALWLTLRRETNLQNMIKLIEEFYKILPAGDPLQALLGATALYFCQDSPHPDRSSLAERSVNLLSHAARQQGITTQAEFDDWFVQNRLDDPNYFLPALDARLREIIGDNWLFDPAQVGSGGSLDVLTH